MLLTLLSAILGAGTLGVFVFNVLLANEYFLNSGTRAPNEIDFFIVVALFLFPILGAVYGGKFGHKLHTEGKTAGIFFHSIYVIIPIALLLLAGAAFMLSAAIATRNSTPLPQNTLLAQQLEAHSWIRMMDGEELEVLSEAQPYQIREISFKTNNECPYGRPYSLTTTLNEHEEGCWFIGAGSRAMGLTAHGGTYTRGYHVIDVTSQTLTLNRAGQTWVFSKKE